MFLTCFTYKTHHLSLIFLSQRYNTFLTTVVFYFFRDHVVCPVREVVLVLVALLVLVVLMAMLDPVAPL